MALSKREIDKRSVKWLEDDICFERGQVKFWTERVAKCKEMQMSEDTVQMATDLLTDSQTRLAELVNQLKERIN